MSQFDYGTIDPTTKSGTQLATDLNNYRNAMHSFHLGSAEPTYKRSGIAWLDNSTNPIWTLKIYDGSAWINLFDLNTTSDSASAYISGLVANLGTAAELDFGTGSLQIPRNTDLGALSLLDTISSGNINASAITSALIADLAVTSGKLAAGSVTTTKLANDIVTIEKIAGYTAGSILYWDASGNPQVLAPASEGTFLKCNGSGVAPSWELATTELVHTAGENVWYEDTNTYSHQSGFGSANSVTVPRNGTIRLQITHYQSGSLAGFRRGYVRIYLNGVYVAQYNTAVNTSTVVHNHDLAVSAGDLVQTRNSNGLDVNAYNTSHITNFKVKCAERIDVFI